MKNKTIYSKKKPKRKATYSKGRSLGSWAYMFVLLAAVVFAGYSLYRWVCIEPAQVSHREVSVKKVVARNSTERESVKSREQVEEHKSAGQADRGTMP
ncbi:MAG: hypothetical protein U9N37_01145, partial [Thermodesulfobacteriota bacterium]|nr:hypothetical protein [Thermodesulfobacteriota bacterium]